MAVQHGASSNVSNWKRRYHRSRGIQFGDDWDYYHLAYCLQKLSFIWEGLWSKAHPGQRQSFVVQFLRCAEHSHGGVWRLPVAQVVVSETEVRWKTMKFPRFDQTRLQYEVIRLGSPCTNYFTHFTTTTRFVIPWFKMFFGYWSCK